MTTADFYIKRLQDQRITSALDQTMMLAIEANDVQALRKFIEHGANPNAAEGMPLIAAVIKGQFPLVQELANQGASFTFAQKLMADEATKWTNIYQKAPGKSAEETEANEARIVFGQISAKVDTYQTAYAETQGRIEAQQAHKKLDEIVQAIDALRETIADITTPKTIKKPASIGSIPARNV